MSPWRRSPGSWSSERQAGKLELSLHRPVLVQEVLDLLITIPDGVYVDGTVGGGGHAAAIVSRLEAGGKLLGLDRDPAAVRVATERLQTCGAVVELVTASFSQLMTVLAVRGIEKVSGVLLDLGISGDQLGSERGFSAQGGGTLDLRFNPDEPRPSAHQLLSGLDTPELTEALVRFGDFTRREARRLATALLETRAHPGGLTEVRATRDALVSRIPPHRRARTLARVFQTLRILVNDELAEIERGLEAAAQALAPGGVLCVISYHSVEDRMVKRFVTPVPPPRADRPLPAGWPEARFEPLTRRPVRPRWDEIALNPRARSAKLRAARRR